MLLFCSLLNQLIGNVKLLFGISLFSLSIHFHHHHQSRYRRFLTSLSTLHTIHLNIQICAHSIAYQCWTSWNWLHRNWLPRVMQCAHRAHHNNYWNGNCCMPSVIIAKLVCLHGSMGELQRWSNIKLILSTFYSTRCFFFAISKYQSNSLIGIHLISNKSFISCWIWKKRSDK